MDTESKPKPPIRLDQFLKLVGIAETGGHAKLLIQSEQVSVNQAVETRRRKQLAADDVVTVDDQEFVVGVIINGGQAEEPTA